MNKFKVGDKVKILDGSEIDDYTGGWVVGMREHIDEVHEIIKVDERFVGGVAYRLKDVFFSWDERGLELAPKFKVGDKVIGNAEASKFYTITKEGWIGTVTKVKDDLCIRVFGDGICDNEGVNVNPEYFDLYTEPVTQKIVITTDGKTTTAVLYNGKKRIKEANATCCPTDTFDFGVGAALALERLVGNPKATLPEENKSEFLNARIYIVDGHDSFMFERGRTYEIKDGMIVGTGLPYGGKLRNFDDLKWYFSSDEMMDKLSHSEKLSHHCHYGVEYKVLSSLDWNKFAHGKLDVKISKEKYGEFMKQCEEKNFKWSDGTPAIKVNPWDLFGEMPDFLKLIISVVGDKPNKYIYITVENGCLKWHSDRNEDIDEYEFI